MWFCGGFSLVLVLVFVWFHLCFSVVLLAVLVLVLVWFAFALSSVLVWL